MSFSYYEKVGEEISCIDDEIPFEIPENWCWSRVSNIVNIFDNQRIPISLAEREKRIIGKTEDQLFPYYGATGRTGYIDDFLFNGRYILLGEDGAPFLDSYATKAYVVSGKFWVNNHAHILQSLISESYLLFCLNSVNYINYVHGTTRLKLTQEDMRNILIPIPPESEQNLIEKNICSVIRFLNAIEAGLN